MILLLHPKGEVLEVHHLDDETLRTLLKEGVQAFKFSGAAHRFFRFAGVGWVAIERRSDAERTG